MGVQGGGSSCLGFLLFLNLPRGATGQLDKNLNFQISCITFLYEHQMKPTSKVNKGAGVLRFWKNSSLILNVCYSPENVVSKIGSLLPLF